MVFENNVFSQYFLNKTTFLSAIQIFYILNKVYFFKQREKIIFYLFILISF